jgi:high-affinity Fe2+/Pb2+ permease
VQVTVQQAEWILIAVAVYAALGALVAAWLLLAGLRRFDAAAAQAPWHVRLLFAPGMVALWPWKMVRALGWQPWEDRS